MTSRPLRIAMVAPPWIEVPPAGYGGVEVAIATLVDGLQDLGHHVELFGIGSSTARVTRLHSVYESAQYAKIFSALYDVAAVPVAHVLAARQAIAADGGFDIVHDHNYLLGPPLLRGAASSPPILHTLHGPLIPADEPEGAVSNVLAHEQIAALPAVWFAAVSHAQLLTAPAAVLHRVLGVAHNAVAPSPPTTLTARRRGFVTMARFARAKGHGVAARLCAQQGMPLRLAGGVGALTTPEEVRAAVASPAASHQGNPELQYFVDEVQPWLRPGLVDYVGSVGGETKTALLGGAEALLMPIGWDEPFGVAAIEALAHGTPVIALARGALPEIIEDGRTGFLARNEAELLMAMSRVSDIDREVCWRAAATRFSGAAMAAAYVEMYREAIDRESGGSAGGHRDAGPRQQAARSGAHTDEWAGAGAGT